MTTSKATFVGMTAGTVLAGAALLGSAGPALAATPSAAGSAAKGCSSGELPSVVLGSPGVKAHQAKGVYLWHDNHGYALRVTEPFSKRLVVTGTITVSADIGNVKKIATEKNDTVIVRGKTLTFRFVNVGGIDGVNFAAECSKTVHVALRANNKALAPEQVFLGAKRQHPSSVPFTIERAHDTTPARMN